MGNKRFFVVLGFVMMSVMVMGSCVYPYPGPEVGGAGGGFKVPVPPGFDWEVTQSWAEHCQTCNDKGYDEIFNGFFSDYCELSHSAYSNCRYAWDFNLPGLADSGVAVLATADGVVQRILYGENGGWGNTVIIDHGEDVCSRSAHLLDDSIRVEAGQKVCQGLKIAEIGGTPDFPVHLHFQFEECGTGVPLEMGFTDGNGVPTCTLGPDIYDSDGDYSFLKLTNREVDDCDDGERTFSGGELPEGGWFQAGCGHLPDCPLIPNCERHFGHEFTDQRKLDPLAADAAEYLWKECVIDGKSDGGLHPNEYITRAEALKIALFLFGLMEECGVSEPFEDVDSQDWYFEVIACAVRNHIIDTTSSYFNAEAEVTFAEAAKFLVESAVLAGVIYMLNPREGHFPRIPASHWAYMYVETIYAYDGLVMDPPSYYPEWPMTRREYIVMTAALSPCFCHNVSCEGRCVCEQYLFACFDHDYQGLHIGGGEDSDERDERDERDEDVELGTRDLDLEIDCYVDTENTLCEGPYTVLYTRCDMTNNSDDEVRINNLIMSVLDPSDEYGCRLTDPDLRRGVGMCIVEAGETKRLSGHYEFSCVEMPEDPEIEVSFDLVERIAGQQTWYFDILEAVIQVPEQPFLDCGTGGCVSDCDGRHCGPDGCGRFCGVCPFGYSCEDGQCVEDPCAFCPIDAECVDDQCLIDDWLCDPDIGYELMLSSPGGWYEVVTALGEYDRGDLVEGWSMLVRFECVDLPAALLVNGGPEWISIQPHSEEPPYFAVWEPFDGELTLQPPFNPDVVVHSFTTTDQTRALLRFPAN